MSRRSTRSFLLLLATGAAALGGAGLVSAQTASNGRIAYSVAPPADHAKDVPGAGPILATKASGRGAVTTIAGRRNVITEGPEYSPDGRRIAWLEGAIGKESKRDGLYVANADGSAPRQLVRTSWTADLAWAPDGRSILYSQITDGVFVVPANGSGKPKKIAAAPDEGSDQGHTFTPDGRTVIYERLVVAGSSPDDYTAQLWKMNADGSGIAPLFPQGRAPAFAAEADVSPDGRTLLFTQLAAGRWSILTAPLDTLEPSTVFTAPAGRWVDGPTWSPDGRKIAFGTGGDDATKQATRLEVLDLATQTTKVVRKASKGFITAPTWQARASG